MARYKASEPKSANLNIEDKKRAIPKIQRLITYLEAFDVATINERSAPRFK